MVKEDVVGKYIEDDTYHDLMEVIIIRRGNLVEKDTIVEYLEGVFTSNLNMVNKYVSLENN